MDLLSAPQKELLGGNAMSKHETSRSKNTKLALEWAAKGNPRGGAGQKLGEMKC